MIKLKDRLKVEVSSLSHEGYGVAKAEGLAIFIPGALINEEVICEVTKIEKNFCNARLVEIVKESKDRVKPICKIFGICGGCEIMHMSYPAQLAFKKNMAKETIKRIGHLEIEIDEIIGMEEPLYYRNKIQVPFGTKKDKVICGYYKKKSHDIISFDECFIQPTYDTEIVKFIKNLANEYHITAYNEETKKGCLRHVLIRSNHKDEVMVVFITNEDKINNIDEIIKKIVNRYPNVISIIQNINKSHTNVILGRSHKVLYGEEFLIDKINELEFKISHYSFFQVNREQTNKLYTRVLDYLNPTKDDVIIDGYCGVGTIALSIATKAKKVFGIEVISDAIEDAKVNAKLNNIKNAEFIVGKVEEEIQNLLEKNITGIVIDPPRKGVEKVVLDSIMKTNINRLVYVSCNVATLARDLNILNEVFEVKNITLVDMFPQTAGVECVTLLERR